MEKFEEYTLIRSKRKTISVEVSAEGEVIVRAPRLKSQKSIDSFVLEHYDWIEKAIEKQKKRKDLRPKEPSPEEVELLKKRAKELLPIKAESFAKIMGVEYSSLKITSAKKRLGSCSYDNRICFSYRVLLYPENVIDYVVIHELAHIKEHNHSRRFYDVVKKYCPEYREIEKLIKG